ncbi:MAG: PrgI family protein [Patescibacteria group bacterium]|jgi:hypothetical protein|nr:PrgI family protein [Patescibacteria group bacterium]
MPQNIEVEDKVIGPLTLRQFSFLIAGLGLSAGLYVLISKLNLPLIISILVSCPPFFVCLSLAFLKFNGRTLDSYISPFFSFLSIPKKRIWKKEEYRPDMGKLTKEATAEPAVSIVTKAPLEQLDEQLEVLSDTVDAANGPKEPKTVFETTKTREKQLEKTIDKNTKEVSEETEPLVAQMASVSPDETFKTWVTTTGDDDEKK